MTSESATLDITPNPKILRALGQIPFDSWQCIAELMDNSLDAFLKADNDGVEIPEKRITVSWSSSAVASEDRNLEILDNAPGMPLSVLQDSVRAGYTSNDPRDNLGLFGMGFNIATARMGERTLILSGIKGSEYWEGVEIDFLALETGGEYKVPVVREPKRKNEHGTKIKVSKLKANAYADLKSRGPLVKQILSSIYSPILQTYDTKIMVQGHSLAPKRHCIWSNERYVTLRGVGTVGGVKDLDIVLGVSLFDVNRYQYLTAEQEDDARQIEQDSGSLPDGIVERTKRITGWIGIQRFADPNDYGLDFVRNGRKILTGEKSLFYYQNVVTQQKELEYPTELGTTVGGRIVGEIHVDHLMPTYQKNDFVRSDQSWLEIVEALRENGPILPRKRTAMGYDGINDSPIGLLVRGYQRADTGTKCLFAPNQRSKEWYQKFLRGDTDYMTDKKWYDAAREADRSRADRGMSGKPPPDPGQSTSDDPSQYGPSGTGGPSPIPSPAATPTPAPQPPPDPLEELKSRSTEQTADSGTYGYERCTNPFNIKIWEVTSGIVGDTGEGDPCCFFFSGMEGNFFYNPLHSFLRTFPTNPMELLQVYLTRQYGLRDRITDEGKLFASLIRINCPEMRIELGNVQARARIIFNGIRDAAPELLALRELEVIEYLHESSSIVEQTAERLLSNPVLLEKFQNRKTGAIEALLSVPLNALIELIQKFPEEWFDEKYFKSPYQNISLPDEGSTHRLRQSSLERTTGFLKDALRVVSDQSSSMLKDELAHCEQSLKLLEKEVV